MVAHKQKVAMRIKCSDGVEFGIKSTTLHAQWTAAVKIGVHMDIVNRFNNQLN